MAYEGFRKRSIGFRSILTLVLVAVVFGAGSVGAQEAESVPTLSFLIQPPDTAVSWEDFVVTIELLWDGVRRSDTYDNVALELVVPDGAYVFLGGTIGQPIKNGLATLELHVVNPSGRRVEGVRLLATVSNVNNPLVAQALSDPFNVEVAQEDSWRLVATKSSLRDWEIADAVNVESHYEIEVEIQDSNGNVGLLREDVLAIALPPGFDGVALSGTTETKAENGVAVFGDVVLTGQPILYPPVLKVIDKSDENVRPLDVVLEQPDVPRQAPAALEVFDGPPSSVGVGEKFGLSVRLVDAEGLPVLQGFGHRIDSLSIELLIVDQRSYAEKTRLGDMDMIIDGTVATVELSVHDGVGNGFKLRITDPGNPDLPPVETSPFTLSGPAYLEFSQVPETLSGGFNLTSGQRLTTSEDPLRVSVYDQNGDLWIDPMEITLLGSAVSGTTTVWSSGGRAEFRDLILDAPEGAHDLVLQAVPQLSLSYYFQDYQWVEAAESPPFNLLTPILLFTGNGDSAPSAVWRQALPKPGEGDSSHYQIPYRFASVQWNLRGYREGEPVVLSGDADGATGFLVDDRWTLTITGEILGTEGLIRGSITGEGSVSNAVKVHDLSLAKEVGLTVDGDLAGLDNLPPGNYGMELVLECSEEPSYGSDDIYLIAGEVWNRREKPLANARKPLKIGADKPTISAGDEVTIPVRIVSAPAPVSGLAVHFDYDPEALEIVDMTAGPGLRIQGMSIRRGGYISLWSGYSGTELGVDDTIFEIRVRGLKAGNWPISFVGNSSGWGIGDETSIAFQSTIGDTVYVTVVDPEPRLDTCAGDVVIGRKDGTIRIHVNGTDLGRVSTVELLSSDGTIQGTTHQLDRAGNGARLTAAFKPSPSPLPAGVYSLRLLDGLDAIVAEGQDVVVPPAVSCFSVYRDDVHPQIPGKPATHTWRVENHGTVDAVAIVLFGFRDYLSQPGKPPILELDGAPDGTRELIYWHSMEAGYMAYVAVPVRAGDYATVPWTVVLDPSAVFGANPRLGVGKLVPYLSTVVGAFNAGQWEEFEAQMAEETEERFDEKAVLDGTNLWQRDTLVVLEGLDSMSEADLARYGDQVKAAYPETARHLFDEGYLSFYRYLIPNFVERGE